VAVAVALAPIAVILLGVGRAGEHSAVLTSLAPAADLGAAAVAGPWPDDAADTSASGGPSAGASASTSTASVSSPGVAGAPSAAASRRPATAAPPSAKTVSKAAASGAASAASSATAPASGPALARVAVRPVSVGLTAPAQQLTDLAYAGTSPAQSLDLYLPRRTGKVVPLLIDIHGGAFMGGAKSDSQGRIDDLLARGYAVASVNYRLSEEAPFPAGVKDVKAAVRWLRAAAPRYGLDATRFAAWGDSAGGYFAVMLGATSGVRTTFDDPALGNPGISSAVQAVVDFYGPVNFLTMDRQAVNPGGCSDAPDLHNEAGSPESLWLGAPIQTVPAAARASNPLTYLTGKGTPPPFFIAHGAADCSVPHGQSLELANALKSRRIPNTTYLLPGIGHGATELDQRMSPLALAFLGRVLRRA
jgi:acetyl esterase/lipase